MPLITLPMQARVIIWTYDISEVYLSYVPVSNKWCILDLGQKAEYKKQDVKNKTLWSAIHQDCMVNF